MREHDELDFCHIPSAVLVKGRVELSYCEYQPSVIDPLY